LHPVADPDGKLWTLLESQINAERPNFFISGSLAASYIVENTSEPVAKPPVLQFAGGVKLRPTIAGFDVTSGKSII
jgi:hypothetical protein